MTGKATHSAALGWARCLPHANKQSKWSSHLDLWRLKGLTHLVHGLGRTETRPDPHPWADAYIWMGPPAISAQGRKAPSCGIMPPTGASSPSGTQIQTLRAIPLLFVVS